jgi:hypothetical protein
MAIRVLNALVLNVWLTAVLVACWFLPIVEATTTPFPDIAFLTFSQSIQDHFSTDIKLSTVVTLLLSLTNNTELLNLHARQQNPLCHGEIKQTVSGWMKAFVWRLQSHLGAATDTLFQPSDNLATLSRDSRITRIGRKLDAIVQTLQLTPYTTGGRHQGWLGNITDITPIQLLCPSTAECHSCRRALHQVVRERDVPDITLCWGSTVYHDVSLLTGACNGCQVMWNYACI